VIVQVDPATGERPPAGADLVVELRDTSIADAPSVTLATVRRALPSGDEPAAEIDLDVDDAMIDPRASLTVFAQCIADSSRGRTKGDWITTESYPVRPGDRDELQSTEITLRQIR
jgi:putative lipoprotein